jgi:hypothetical protein
VTQALEQEMKRTITILCLALAVHSVLAEETNALPRVVADNRARRSLDPVTYYLPKGTPEFILDFSKVLRSFEKMDPDAKRHHQSVIVLLPAGSPYDVQVKLGQESVRLGVDTLRDILGRSSFKGFGDKPFEVSLGELKKTRKGDNLDLQIDASWSCRIVMR